MPNWNMRIAHLSDLHLLSEDRRSRSWAAQFVSLHRPLDLVGRKEKLVRALQQAKARGAEHVVLSGDLTEVGASAEFEVLAHLLADSPFAPRQITLVPGNHDAYTARDGWKRAFEGPLAPYRSTSSVDPNTVKPVDLGSVVLLPVDTTCYQSVASSCGVFTSSAGESLRAHLRGTSEASAARVIVQHHPPFPRKSAAWQRIDGLRGWQGLLEILLAYPTLALLHGHMHRIVTRVLGSMQHARIFGASATVDDRETRLRVYEPQAGLLASVGAASLAH